MNIVWFCIDTLRADHLGCYGYFRETSPTIDRLAEEGVLFPQSRANGVPTGPAFTSIFTGKYCINNEWYVTPYDIPDVLNFSDKESVFSEVIRDAGLTTAAFDNLFTFASHMKQFVRGFEYYVNVTKTTKPRHHEVVGADVNARLLPWLRQHNGEPFFLFVHYWDPHLPYNQPEEFARPFIHERGKLHDLEVRTAPAGYSYVPGWGVLEHIDKVEGPTTFERNPDSPSKHPLSIDSYDGEILYADSLIEEVLKEMDRCGILNDTAVIVDSDHGEQLKQHLDLWGHAGLHDSHVFTPLILWRPGLLPSGVRPEGYVLHVDIAPTMLDLLGLGADFSTEGVSLLPLIRGEASPRDHYFCETMAMRSIERDGWKYIWHIRAKDELYHITDDPMEQINLIEDEPERAGSLQEELFLWVEKNLKGRSDPLEAQLNRVEELRSKPYPFY